MNGTNPSMLKKFSVEDIRQMREMRMQGVDVPSLARIFNTYKTTISWHTDAFAPKVDLGNYPFDPLDI